MMKTPCFLRETPPQGLRSRCPPIDSHLGHPHLRQQCKYTTCSFQRQQCQILLGKGFHGSTERTSLGLSRTTRACGEGITWAKTAGSRVSLTIARTYTRKPSG